MNEVLQPKLNDLDKRLSSVNSECHWHSSGSNPAPATTRMRVDLAPGRYILAVSGGVDSMVLLDILAKQPSVKQQKSSGTSDSGLATSDSMSLQLIVAHFNHDIRSDSTEDEKLVAQAAKKYHLPFEVGHGNLGPKASEDKARKARYAFLEFVKKKYGADAIITAHHQDDLIETAFINILRGTGRQGLTSIRSPKVVRPLLSFSKKDLLKYAQANKIQRHEDATNKDTKYLRNYIRQNVLPKLTIQKRTIIINNLDKVAKINKIIDQEIATLSQNTKRPARQKFIMLPPEVCEELMVWWLRKYGLREFDRKTIKRLSAAIKTAPAGSEHEIIRGRKLRLSASTAEIV